MFSIYTWYFQCSEAGIPSLSTRTRKGKHGLPKAQFVSLVNDLMLSGQSKAEAGKAEGDIL